MRGLARINIDPYINELPQNRVKSNPTQGGCLQAAYLQTVLNLRENLQE